MVLEKLTVKQYRLIKGYTQQQVADSLGIHINNYASKERGDRDFSFGEMIKIANIVNVDINLIASPYQLKHNQ